MHTPERSLRDETSSPISPLPDVGRNLLAGIVRGIGTHLIDVVLDRSC